MINNEIKRNWFFTQSKEKVWEYLTKAELIETWLMPNNFKLKVGRDFQFTTNPIPSLKLSGIFYCKVLEIEPLEKLVYSWKGGLSESDPSLETIVTWTLSEKDNGTELNLLHTGFNNDNEIILTSMYNGWDEHVQKIIKNLNLS